MDVQRNKKLASCMNFRAIFEKNLVTERDLQNTLSFLRAQGEYKVSSGLV